MAMSGLTGTRLSTFSSGPYGHLTAQYGASETVVRLNHVSVVVYTPCTRQASHVHEM